jgi:DNA phosphorothioation-dependent restriction protein DptH
MSSPHRSANDLLALATLRANCEKADKEQSVWPPLAEGFFVPIDEIADVIELDSRTFGGESRPDLIFVCIRDRALAFQFIRVCFRRHLRLARDPDFLDRITEEVIRARDAWERKFSAAKGSAVERAIRRSSLARVLHFYNDKARRHANHSGLNCFDEDTYRSLRSEIDKMLSTAGDYQFAESSADSVFLFCPEYVPREPERIYDPGIGDVSFYLFGPEKLNVASPSPHERARNQEDGGTPRPQDTPSQDSHKEVSPTSGPNTSSSDNESERDIDLGKDIATDTPVKWVLSIKRNPHLMIAGLPGMGKTTSLVNICRQLNQFGIGPIIFSYHPDIDARLESHCRVVQYVDYNGLSFNPLRVDASTIGAFIDVAGDLRDIFLAIFPDLGDIQAETIRFAIKQSYIDSGWTLEGTNEDVPVPEFSSFFEIIKGEKRADRGVVFRLGELADYGLFKTPSGSRSLLDARGVTIVRIHRTGNELLQRAFATFVLYSVYKDMLKRGPVDDLSHAVVFDEAHRASRLRLLPRMAKECRKYGLSLILASQEARDFDRSLFSAIASYLTLRVTENDARVLAKQATSSQMERRIVDRLKQLDHYRALFFTEGNVRPREVRLAP